MRLNGRLMIDAIPFWVEALFLFTCLFSLVLFYFANSKAPRLMLLLLVWCSLHALLAYQGFYQNTTAVPPRFALVLVPSALFIIYGLRGTQKKWFLKHRHLKFSSLLHLLRLPVEIVLYQLFLYKMVPELMTFTGRNFDIVMGLSAPLVAWLVYKERISRKMLIAWNSIGLALILFILVNGVLSAELPIQQFAFDQPNRGLNYFPFILLPALLVPMVIWMHISDLIYLQKNKVDLKSL